jgi:hypothetical protein
VKGRKTKKMRGEREGGEVVIREVKNGEKKRGKEDREGRNERQEEDE